MAYPVTKDHIKVFVDPESVAQHVAAIIKKLSIEAINDHGLCTISCSGGTTPKLLYEVLTTQPYISQIDWLKIHIFIGDERYVPMDNEQNNFNMINEALFSKVSIPKNNIHYIDTNLTSLDAAEDYEAKIKTFFTSKNLIESKKALPIFDIVVLGIGEDGHTASLFPDTDAISQEVKLVVVAESPKSPHTRISITFPILNIARHVLFIVIGADKAEILKTIVKGDNISLPASMVTSSNDSVYFFADEKAGKFIHIFC